MSVRVPGFAMLLAALLTSGGMAPTRQEGLARYARDGWQPLTSSDEDRALVEKYQTGEYAASWALEAIGAARAYALLEKNGLPVGGRGVVAAVSDQGVDFEHPELAGKAGPVQLVRGHSDAHGTHIAGSIAAKRDGKGMHGVAFDARIMAISEDRWSDLVEAARDPLVKVINASWSETDEDDMRENREEGLGLIAEIARADVVLVASLHQGDEERPGYPAELAPEPAAAGVLLTVGAVDAEGRLASHPCGEQLAGFAVLAPGEGVVAPAASGGPAGDQRTLDDRTFYVWSGTSMAAPQVTGAVCVLRAAWPELRAAEVVQALLRSARRIGPEDQVGQGALDLYAAVQLLGSGELGPRGGSGAQVFELRSEDGDTGRAERTASGLRLQYGADVYDYERMAELDSEDGQWIGFANEVEMILWPSANRGPYYYAAEGDEEFHPTGWSVR
jgi:subtilisin family serine protease